MCIITWTSAWKNQPYGLFAQGRLRSALTSVQSDRSLHCVLIWIEKGPMNSSCGQRKLWSDCAKALFDEHKGQILLVFSCHGSYSSFGLSLCPCNLVGNDVRRLISQWVLSRLRWSFLIFSRGRDKIPAACCDGVTEDTIQDYVENANCGASDPPKNFHKTVYSLRP